MDRKKVEKYILSLPNSVLGYPFGKDIAVYSVNDQMFGLLMEGRLPLLLSLKCDPELSKILRQKYETVMPGHNLNKKYWNTILLSGQLSWMEVQDLIRHAYELAAET
jgi:predicted DNA-binding protein (MmcQ/YjbR family)